MGFFQKRPLRIIDDCVEDAWVDMNPFATKINGKVSKGALLLEPASQGVGSLEKFETVLTPVQVVSSSKAGSTYSNDQDVLHHDAV